MSSSKKRIYIETYGCQMNLADTEVILSLLTEAGYEITEDIARADVILANTCSVREHAEQRIYGRLGEFKKFKMQKPGTVVGVLGCMAERMRSRLTGEDSRGVGQIADLLVGPDEYRKLPSLVGGALEGETGIAVRLSRVETYDDILPLRTSGISAWISVMRGCDKFCSFCVVPFTRGRERSRGLGSIVKEVELLSRRGFKEVTLLGQNVNSYRDAGHDFADLLRATAEVDPSVRIRFTTSHPQDMSDKLISTIGAHNNICKYIHLPVQSGSDRILDLMHRNYSREHYQNLVSRIRSEIPDVCLSTDIIAGFPGEREEDHRATMELLSFIRFDGAFMFKYSPRENTPAFQMPDNIPDEVKSKRIDEIIRLQTAVSLEKNMETLGKTLRVLAEGESKKSPDDWQGRTDGNKTVVFPRGSSRRGDYVNVRVRSANSATLFGSLASAGSPLSKPERKVEAAA